MEKVANAFTCNLDSENRKILELKKINEGYKLGETVNLLISTFGVLPSEVSSELLEYIDARVQVLSVQAESAGGYEKERLAEIIKKYKQIAAYLNNGKALKSQSSKSVSLMQEIPIKNGILKCPETYVITNPEEAAESLYACVIECRNSERYGIPHYLVHCDRKYGSDYDADYEVKLLQKVLAKDPSFQKIIDLQVKPMKNSEALGTLLNSEEFLKSPEIGFFHVYEHGDPAYPPDYNPPYGVEIVRDGTLKYRIK